MEKTIVSILVKKHIDKYLSMYDNNKADYLNTIRIQDIVNDLKELTLQLEMYEWIKENTK